MRDRAVYDLAKVEVKYISTKSCSFNNFGKTNPIFSHLSNDLRFSNPRAEVTAEGTCARWTPSMGSLRTSNTCCRLDGGGPAEHERNYDRAPVASAGAVDPVSIAFSVQRLVPLRTPRAVP